MTQREIIQRVVNAWIDNQTMDLIADLTAALAASRPPEEAKPVADGWKLVPIKPTDEMKEAAGKISSTRIYQIGTFEAMCAAYNYMLARETAKIAAIQRANEEADRQ